MLARPQLKTKLLLSFLLTGVLSIGITGWQAYERAREALEEETFNRLTAVRAAKRQQVESYILKVKTDVIGYSNDQLIAAATRELLPAFRFVRSCFPDEISCSRLLSSLCAGTTVPNPQYQDYVSAYLRYNNVIQKYMSLHGYYDIFIVDADNGNVIYTVTRENDFATNLLHGCYSQSGISSVFRTARESTDRDDAHFVDFEPYAPSAYAAASFAASPIVIEGQTVAVLIFQMSIDGINSLMTENNTWEASGMGKSGETYLVGTDYRMRNDSRCFIEQTDEYFRLLRRIGTEEEVIDAIRSNRTSILLQEVRTEAVIDALQGHTDTKIVRDYRGVTVLSSYTPLHIEGLYWVLLSEIDAVEAFSSVYRLREHLILIGLIIALFAIVMGYIISRTISHPILQLVDVTDRFGRGDHSNRAKVDTDDEIGLLGRSFNTMAEKIENDTVRLREEVTERRRTEEMLKTSREQYRSLSLHLQTVREMERKSIAREIHDELGQNLTALGLDLALLQKDMPESGMRSRIDEMSVDIDKTIVSVKRIISELRPGILDDLGLVAAMEWLAEDFQNRTGIQCTISILPQDFETDQERSTTVFRILQETLTNAARHAHADSVTIRLVGSTDCIDLLVHDNGRGIRNTEIDDPKAFGLIGIRERAYAWSGDVEIEGRPGAGTTVSVRIPNNKAAAQDD